MPQTNTSDSGASSSGTSESGSSDSSSSTHQTKPYLMKPAVGRYEMLLAAEKHRYGGSSVKPAKDADATKAKAKAARKRTAKSEAKKSKLSVSTRSAPTKPAFYNPSSEIISTPMSMIVPAKPPTKVVYKDPRKPWLHPSELAYPRTTMSKSQTIHELLLGAFSVAPRSRSSNDILVSITSCNGEVTTIPRAYRPPLLFVANFQWKMLGMVLGEGMEGGEVEDEGPQERKDREWREYGSEILYLSRLCRKFFEEAREASKADGGMQRIWRCATFDRALIRYYRKWLSSKEKFLREFWDEFGEEEYELDVLKLDWPRFILKGHQGFFLVPADIQSGITARHFIVEMAGLIKHGLISEQLLESYFSPSPPQLTFREDTPQNDRHIHSPMSSMSPMSALSLSLPPTPPMSRLPSPKRAHVANNNDPFESHPNQEGETPDPQLAMDEEEDFESVVRDLTYPSPTAPPEERESRIPALDVSANQATLVSPPAPMDVDPPEQTTSTSVRPSAQVESSHPSANGAEAQSGTDTDALASSASSSKSRIPSAPLDQQHRDVVPEKQTPLQVPLQPSEDPPAEDHPPPANETGGGAQESVAAPIPIVAPVAPVPQAAVVNTSANKKVSINEIINRPVSRGVNEIASSSSGTNTVASSSSSTNAPIVPPPLDSRRHYSFTAQQPLTVPVKAAPRQGGVQPLHMSVAQDMSASTSSIPAHAGPVSSQRGRALSASATRPLAGTGNGRHRVPTKKKISVFIPKKKQKAIADQIEIVTRLMKIVQQSGEFPSSSDSSETEQSRADAIPTPPRDVESTLPVGGDLRNTTLRPNAVNQERAQEKVSVSTDAGPSASAKVFPEPIKEVPRLSDTDFDKLIGESRDPNAGEMDAIRREEFQNFRDRMLRSGKQRCVELSVENAREHALAVGRSVERARRKLIDISLRGSEAKKTVSSAREQFWMGNGTAKIDTETIAESRPPEKPPQILHPASTVPLTITIPAPVTIPTIATPTELPPSISRVPGTASKSPSSIPPVTTFSTKPTITTPATTRPPITPISAVPTNAITQSNVSKHSTPLTPALPLSATNFLQRTAPTTQIASTNPAKQTTETVKRTPCSNCKSTAHAHCFNMARATMPLPAPPRPSVNRDSPKNGESFKRKASKEVKKTKSPSEKKGEQDGQNLFEVERTVSRQEVAPEKKRKRLETIPTEGLIPKPDSPSEDTSLGNTVEDVGRSVVLNKVASTSEAVSVPNVMEALHKSKKGEDISSEGNRKEDEQRVEIKSHEADSGGEGEMDMDLDSDLEEEHTRVGDDRLEAEPISSSTDTDHNFDRTKELDAMKNAMEAARDLLQNTLNTAMSPVKGDKKRKASEDPIGEPEYPHKKPYTLTSVLPQANSVAVQTQETPSRISGLSIVESAKLRDEVKALKEMMREMQKRAEDNAQVKMLKAEVDRLRRRVAQLESRSTAPPTISGTSTTTPQPPTPMSIPQEKLQLQWNRIQPSSSIHPLSHLFDVDLAPDPSTDVQCDILQASISQVEKEHDARSFSSHFSGPSATNVDIPLPIKSQRKHRMMAFAPTTSSAELFPKPV